MHDNYPQAAEAGYIGKVIQDPMSTMTVGQNLERKITEHKNRLIALEASLVTMKESGLYNVKLGELRDAMSY